MGVVNGQVQLAGRNLGKGIVTGPSKETEKEQSWASKLHQGENRTIIVNNWETLPLCPLTPKISLVNSPYCLPYNSYNVNLENLVSDQLVIP